MSDTAGHQADPARNRAISDGMFELCVTFYEQDRTTATASINDDIVVCVLEDILTAAEDTPSADHARRRARAARPRRRAIDCPEEE